MALLRELICCHALPFCQAERPPNGLRNQPGGLGLATLGARLLPPLVAEAKAQPKPGLVHAGLGGGKELLAVFTCSCISV